MNNNVEVSIVTIFEDFIKRYISARKIHLHNWLNVQRGLGRIFNCQKTFDHLRRKDFELTKSFEAILKKLINKNNLDKNQLLSMKYYLKNHRLILNFRLLFLTLFLAIGAASYAFLKEMPFKWPMDCRDITTIVLMSLLGLSLFYERWNIKQKDAIYQEIENLIQSEIDKMS